ncbi:MAG: hypothetical protein ACPLZG_11190, partial [Thermoproteota archaeon]
VGILHAHDDLVPKPLQEELVLWLTMMFEFDRSLLFFIISMKSLKIAAYTIPPDIFAQLKDAIKLIKFEGERC